MSVREVAEMAKEEQDAADAEKAERDRVAKAKADAESLARQTRGVRKQIVQVAKSGIFKLGAEYGATPESVEAISVSQVFMGQKLSNKRNPKQLQLYVEVQVDDLLLGFPTGLVMDYDKRLPDTLKSSDFTIGYADPNQEPKLLTYTADGRLWWHSVESVADLGRQLGDRRVGSEVTRASVLRGETVGAEMNDIRLADMGPLGDLVADLDANRLIRQGRQRAAQSMGITA